MLFQIPWNDPATLTRVNAGSGLREEVERGPLHIVLSVLSGIEPSERKDFRIAFADRTAAPFGYGPENFPELIRQALMR